jgi:hypothetical protein
MIRYRGRGARLAAAILVVMACTLANAEDIEGRWRIGVGIGATDTRDEVRSNSANVLILTDQDDVPETFWIDPRNDRATFNALSIQPAPLANINAQYGVNKIFIVELSAGYSEGDVGEIEVQGKFPREPLRDPNDPFRNFRIFEINAGTITQVPVRATMFARFRPKANFNPYLGVGVGYIFVGFEPSAEFDELSKNMDRSVGGFATLPSGFPSDFNSPTSISDLEGAKVDAEDAWEWHVTGGIEFTVKRKWSTFLELTWSQASRSMAIGFNGATSLGVSVLPKREFADTYTGSTTFGAYRIVSGGLVDGGSLVPINPNDPVEICQTDPNACVFDPNAKDGIPDEGDYYAQGGEFRYDHFALQVGFRYAF